MNRKYKCAHNECGDHCSIFREIGQRTLFPKPKAKPVATYPQIPTPAEKPKPPRKKIVKKKERKGYKATFYKVKKDA